MTFYRYLLVGLVLCGCAWGQKAAPEMNDAPADVCHPEGDYIVCPNLIVPNMGSTDAAKYAVKIPDPPVMPAVQHCIKNIPGNQVCPFPPDYPKHSGYKWTCADKSRVLLTTEGGKKICVKF
jgi:hypothetical protein